MDKNTLPEEILKIQQAMEQVEKEYFLIKRVKLTPAKRERVYCYELYHQMRLQDFGGYIIHGEIDKSGNKSFKKINPDFVIHEPGKEENLITIEAKVNSGKKGIEKDLKKLQDMISTKGYKYGVFILVGRSIEWFEKHRKRMCKNIVARGIEDQIFIMCQEYTVEGPAVGIKRLSEIQEKNSNSSTEK